MHTTQEVAHADWSIDALAALEADPAVVRAAARVAADAWWDVPERARGAGTRGAAC